MLEQKQSSFQVAKDLGISASGMAKWVRQAKIDNGKGPVGALTSEERGELGQLRRENRTLKMERELLKKWAVDSIGRSNAECFIH